jgi:two-component system, chemotaxis family, chemotaxis protein CheY
MATILICDDDELYREIAGAAFTDSGHQILFATNGDEAAAMLASHTIDVLVTDLVMPGKDGLELIKDVRRLAQPVSVLAMTAGLASLKDPLLIAASAFGANDVIQKPFRPMALRQKVDELLKAAARERGESAA